MLEQLHYNLMYRWFVGLSPDDPIWRPTTFTKNRERLLDDQVMGRFLEKLMGAPEVKARLAELGMSPVPPNTPEEFSALVRKDLEHWTRFVRSRGLKPS